MNKQFITRINSLVSGAAKSNVTLFLAGKDCINQAYAGNKEYAQYALDNLPVAYRAPFASFLRRCGLNITALTPKDNNGKRDGYIAGGVLDQKKQGAVQAKLKDWESVHLGKTPRDADFKGDVLVLNERTYKEPVKKELSHEPSEIEKRAKLAVEKLIGNLRTKDKDAAGVLNNLWAAKTAVEMAFIDSQGVTMNLSVEECNAVMGLLHEMRK